MGDANQDTTSPNKPTLVVDKDITDKLTNVSIVEKKKSTRGKKNSESSSKNDQPEEHRVVKDLSTASIDDLQRDVPVSSQQTFAIDKVGSDKPRSANDSVEKQKVGKKKNAKPVARNDQPGPSEPKPRFKQPEELLKNVTLWGNTAKNQLRSEAAKAAKAEKEGKHYEPFPGPDYLADIFSFPSTLFASNIDAVSKHLLLFEDNDEKIMKRMLECEPMVGGDDSATSFYNMYSKQFKDESKNLTDMLAKIDVYNENMTKAHVYGKMGIFHIEAVKLMKLLEDAIALSNTCIHHCITVWLIGRMLIYYGECIAFTLDEDIVKKFIKNLRFENRPKMDVNKKKLMEQQCNNYCFFALEVRRVTHETTERTCAVVSTSVRDVGKK
ncbi:unnamed protein product [Caenorhabditis bovis]|uniref:Uncharacterized protein n=1 Tax=Caenorhabditis bovis TaxID=2654633 RepID=A0A8S1FCD9_9PELO|nr:unnamed protein product [Caenorhabditis bovis]